MMYSFWVFFALKALINKRFRAQVLSSFARYLIISITQFNIPMAYITKATHIEFMNELYEINNNPKLGVYSKDFKKMLGQFEAMLSYHNKILFIRFNLHLKKYSSDNAIISKYFNKLSKGLLVKFKLKRFGYIWCREHNDVEAQHYHVAIMVDGNKYQKAHGFLEYFREKWEALGQHFSYNWNPTYDKNRQYIKVIRDDWHDYQELIYWLSYLAKSNTKSNRRSTTNKYGTSRLKKRVNVG